MKELWKDIPDYPGYQASNIGRIRSKDRVVHYSDGRNRKYKGTVLRPRANGLGYLEVYPGFAPNGRRNTVGVHRLIAMAHIPNPEEKPFINHKDGNPGNNNINNLEWVTPQENSQHAKYVLKNASYGTPCQKVICVETGVVYDSIRRAWRETGVHWSDIARALDGKEGRARAGGYHWKKA